MECNKKIILAISEIAHRVRLRILELSLIAGKNGAHVGGSLSSVELFATLYHSVLRRNSAKLAERDRLIVSKGHSALALYCSLETVGLLQREEVESFERNGSLFCAHAKRDVEKGIEFSGGSLSLGISYAVGVALACKAKSLDSHVYVLVGDGECNEGLLWEALMSASNFKLNNLTIIVDRNGLQSDGFAKDVMDMSPLKEKFAAFGFQTSVINGHCVEDLLNAFSNKNPQTPNAIIANTVKGKGVSFMENDPSWHHGVLTEKLYRLAVEELRKTE